MKIRNEAYAPFSIRTEEGCNSLVPKETNHTGFATAPLSKRAHTIGMFPPSFLYTFTIITI